MKRSSFLVTASLALVMSMLLTGATSEAAGPNETAAVGAPVTPLAARRVVQDTIVPHGFFTLPSAHRGVIKDSIVPHGFFTLPSAHQGRPHRRGPRRSIVTGAFAPPLIVSAPPVGAYVPEDYADTPGYYAAPDNSPAAYSPPWRLRSRSSALSLSRHHHPSRPRMSSSMKPAGTSSGATG